MPASAPAGFDGRTQASLAVFDPDAAPRKPCTGSNAGVRIRSPLTEGANRIATSTHLHNQIDWRVSQDQVKNEFGMYILKALDQRYQAFMSVGV